MLECTYGIYCDLLKRLQFWCSWGGDTPSLMKGNKKIFSENYDTDINL